MSIGILSRLLQYFPKNRAEKEFVKIRFQLFYDKKKKEKKVLWPLNPRGGGGKALMARPLREDFFAASLKIWIISFNWGLDEFKCSLKSSGVDPGPLRSVSFRRIRIRFNKRIREWPGSKQSW